MTKKEFRTLLNEQDKTARGQAVKSNSKYRPTKRLYGDCLYSQARDIFDYDGVQHNSDIFWED